jgi:hypothetical protein
MNVVPEVVIAEEPEGRANLAKPVVLDAVNGAVHPRPQIGIDKAPRQKGRRGYDDAAERAGDKSADKQQHQEWARKHETVLQRHIDEFIIVGTPMMCHMGFELIQPRIEQPIGLVHDPAMRRIVKQGDERRPD